MSPPGSGSSELPTLPLPVATHIGVLRVQSESRLQKEDKKEAHRGRRHQALCGRTEKTGPYSDFDCSIFLVLKLGPPSK